MNPFERPVWVLFVFIMNFFLIAFIFLVERTPYRQGIKADDETGESIEETETN